MNSVISFIQNMILRQVFTLFLIGFVFFSMELFANTGIQSASAETVTSPEGVYYKAMPNDEVHKNYNSENVVEQAKNKLEETTETIREKLNLDEETPRATKEFLRSTENRVEKAVEPLTGTRSGYYQIP
ncbi:MAG: hypothetical protein IGS39_01700 [Calothrix sp. C42_A2020_038]|nr:hypothetical protein [Calothrix sp. C42_A2020_038]